MTVWRPDPTFYPSARSAMTAPPEEFAYVVRVNPNGDERPDAIVVIDTSPTSSTYGQQIGEVEMSYAGDELHHFNWNACSSMLCPSAAHPHVERRYLIVPALKSSRIYIIDTKPDPTRPRIVKTIESQKLTGPGLVPFRYSKDSHAGYTGAQLAEIKDGETVVTGKPLVTDDGDGDITEYGESPAKAPASGVPAT